MVFLSQPCLSNLYEASIPASKGEMNACDPEQMNPPRRSFIGDQ